MHSRRAIPWGARPPGVPAGKGVRVVVVDSGVNPRHFHVGGRVDGARIYRGEDGGVHRGPEYQDTSGHGTAIAAVIRHVAPEADLFALKIFNGALATTPDVLEGALSYALQAGARVVNLSLGMGSAPNASFPAGPVPRRGTGGDHPGGVRAERREGCKRTGILRRGHRRQGGRAAGGRHAGVLPGGTVRVPCLPMAPLPSGSPPGEKFPREQFRRREGLGRDRLPARRVPRRRPRHLEGNVEGTVRVGNEDLSIGNETMFRIFVSF